MIEEALRAVLLADAGVAALVGTRVYPLVLPQAGTLPAITYQVVAGDADYVMEGASGLAFKRVQVDCWADTYSAAAGLRAAVTAALGGFAGSAGSPAVRIQGAFKTMEADGYEDALERAGPRLWRKTIDFNVHFEEA